MATLSPTELLDWLGQSQFLSAGQIAEMRPMLSSFLDSHAFAKELIRRDWLTPYQVNQILQGRHDQLALGEYRLLERIGEGAMGQVFKARNVRQDRVVAVKTILKKLIENERALTRFRREIEAVSQLDHPNIARVRDADEIDGRPFMVMEFIEGIDLARRVKQGGALPIHEAVEYIRQAALGLQHAFERGIVHRDIKPANLMVTAIRYNDEPITLVKILDFGLARYEIEGEGDGENANRLTQVGKLLGTIDYIAPEQATDARTADIRADIYSLGCTLFYLLTGRPAFLGNDVVEKLGPRVTGEPPWVRTVRADVPPGLEAVLCKMMARRPEDRYQTPLETAEALAPYATTETEGTTPASVPIAAPVHAPTGAPVALALPIASDAPLATPIAAAIPLQDDSSFMEMRATGRDLSSGASAARPAPAKSKPFPLKLVLILAGVALAAAMLVLTICLLAWFFGNKLPQPQGTLRITEAWVGDPKIIPGVKLQTFVNIRFDRAKFRGPIKFTLHDLPPEIYGEEKIVAETARETQVRLTIGTAAKPITTQIRVRAEGVLEEVSTEISVPLVIIADPKKKKK